MTRHPDPTVATVKELYGTATHCAYPSCTEPLYRQVPEISAAALNSTVAHIRAASPEGPRFDESMTPEQNRAVSNLLLLCRFHAALVDAKESAFSVDQLRQWKDQQHRQGPGTPITDDQAREVLRTSISTEISMQAETINVGGQWGGGGGAIGAGAVGGPGGDSIRLNLEGAAPGGGGGVLMGPGRTPPDAVRAKEGRGYSLGTDGGDTYITDSEGNVLAYARGGSAGSSKYTQRSTTRALSVSSMMICNSIDIRNGLLFVLGGAWQSYTLVNTPDEVSLIVLLVIEAGGVDVGHYSAHVSAQGPDGRACGQVRFPVIVEEPGDILRIVRWVPLTIHVESYGLYTLTTSTDTDPLASIDLAIKRVTDG